MGTRREGLGDANSRSDVKPEERRRPEPARRALLDHYDDAGVVWIVDVEAEVGDVGEG